MRNIFIDCGAWTGDSILEFKKHYPDYELYAFECHPDLVEDLRILSKNNFTLLEQAVWTKNGLVELYHGANDMTQSSTLFSNKKKFIVRSNPSIVKSIDFSQWIKNNFSPDDNIVCKMNIEGAEYEILQKMILDKTISYIKKLYVAWHYNKLKGFDKSIHDELVKKLPKFTELKKWDYDEREGKNPY